MFTIKMSVELCLILFIAPFCLAEKGKIDPQTLHNVFGDPQQFIANHGPLGAQAVPITPYNATLEDPDYWDANDDFTPSSLDYDRFDWTLTKRVAVDSPGNFLLSPLGLKLALAILAEAATGNTQTELASVLNYDQDRKVVRRKFSSILSSLRADSNQYILNLGSRVYIYKNAEPRQRFAAIASEFYGTEIKRIDFDKPAVASKEINDWVSNITAGRIPNLVDADEVQNMVVLILNTLYFKGNWRHQFAPNETKPAPFYLSAKVQKQIPFMHVREKFYFAESAKYDAKILRMSYLGHKFAMYIVVPNSIAGLSRVFDGLNDLRSEINYLQEKIVDVTIPKFQFDYTSQLDGVLRELGIRQAFEDTASFPGISRGQLLHQRLRVSKVLQRSGIEVNELGSIAYSATEIALVNKFGQDSDSYQELVANKPFLFYIEDEGTRQLLFTGRVMDPSKPDGTFKH